MDETVLLTTTNNFEGYSILEYKDVISEEVCFANKLVSQFKNIVNDFFSSLDSLFDDTELSGTTVAILKAKEYVKEKIKAKAKSIGANAIVGIDFETSYGSSSTNIRVSINGTAVVVKKIDDLKREKEEARQHEAYEMARKEKLRDDKEKFKNSDKFIYSLHEDNINAFTTAKEIVEYVVSLNIKDDYISNAVIPELKKIAELERFYGNKYVNAKEKLKEMTDGIRE